MTIKMIAVDMDGTFLDENSSYNQERFNQIYQILKERKIRFVVASGNPYLKLQNCFPEIKDELTYIAENGGYIIDQGEELFLLIFQLKIASLLLMHLKQCLMCYAGYVPKNSLIP
ncbi:HAD hydrolase family protein [Coprobacillaceae bacterium CR2/5/TPMF4]|nr:HAD hydrolase family protein [Coprobacillaceae bacterium CR2/5/TPMF4]